VPKAGFEPARVSPHAPQTCVSAIPPLRRSECEGIIGSITDTVNSQECWISHPTLKRNASDIRKVDTVTTGQ
jgi:hypothetical protein